VSRTLRSVVDELELALPPGTVVTDPDVIEGYRFDRSNAVEAGRPLAVVRAANTAEVQTALRWASLHRVPVVTRGAGTGLSGGSLAVDGCITLSTERMRRVEIDAPARLAVAQPGALNVEVKAAARAQGLWYPPDPSSFEICSIGGNVATNAGGLCCVKYGVTTDYVLGMEVVLADGRVLRLGGRTIKDVAGYDLKRLFTGSEGTLGVVTEVRLRLRPPPPAPTTMVATFSDAKRAGRAISTIAARGNPAVLELMDRTSVLAVERQFNMGLAECGALLLGQSDVGGAQGMAEVTTMMDACQEAGADEVYSTADEVEGNQFMAARRAAIPAVEKMGSVLIEDVGVPLPRVAELITGIERVSERRSTLIATIGHAGDGNFHPLVVFDRANADAVARAELAFGEVMDLAISLGGTITGEHGVGTLKREWLEEQIGNDALGVMRDIKDALDPLGILNPGKAI
jgi:glycolate oxidase